MVLPMIRWQVPASLARAFAIAAIFGLLACLLWFIWSVRVQLRAPLLFVRDVTYWPSTRSLLSQFCVILVVLICVEWLQLRPIYRDLRSLQTAMKRYVLPRHLTDAQISTIANYLSERDPQDIKIVQLKNNEESSAYRADFQNAFTKGGWKVAIDISDDIPEGVCSNFMRTISNSQKQPNPKQPNAEELLIEAFRQARIQLNQRSGGSGQGISNDSLTLTIGRRRVDDSDIRGREATMEMYNRLLKETEQDD
jgi:hypothetical protein